MSKLTLLKTLISLSEICSTILENYNSNNYNSRNLIQYFKKKTIQKDLMKRILYFIWISMNMFFCFYRNILYNYRNFIRFILFFIFKCQSKSIMEDIRSDDAN